MNDSVNNAANLAEDKSGGPPKLTTIKRLFLEINTIMAQKIIKNDRHPSQIVPRLYLGSLGPAFSKETLENNQIKNILCVANNIQPCFPKDYCYKVIKVQDKKDENISLVFEESICFIDKSIKEEKNILVHCFAGISRSATIVAAYLMKEKNMTLEQALSLIKYKRTVAQPNEGFLEQLAEYEKLLSNRSSSDNELKCDSQKGEERNIIGEGQEIAEKENFKNHDGLISINKDAEPFTRNDDYQPLARNDAQMLTKKEDTETLAKDDDYQPFARNEDVVTLTKKEDTEALAADAHNESNLINEDKGPLALNESSEPVARYEGDSEFLKKNESEEVSFKNALDTGLTNPYEPTEEEVFKPEAKIGEEIPAGIMHTNLINEDSHSKIEDGAEIQKLSIQAQNNFENEKAADLQNLLGEESVADLYVQPPQSNVHETGVNVTGTILSPDSDAIYDESKHPKSERIEEVYNEKQEDNAQNTQDGHVKNELSAINEKGDLPPEEFKNSAEEEEKLNKNIESSGVPNEEMIVQSDGKSSVCGLETQAETENFVQPKYEGIVKQASQEERVEVASLEKDEGNDQKIKAREESQENLLQGESSSALEEKRKELGAGKEQMEEKEGKGEEEKYEGESEKVKEEIFDVNLAEKQEKKDPATPEESKEEVEAISKTTNEGDAQKKKKKKKKKKH